jgi:hypothetical protein
MADIRFYGLGPFKLGFNPLSEKFSLPRDKYGFTFYCMPSITFIYKCYFNLLAAIVLSIFNGFFKCVPIVWVAMDGSNI